MSDLFGNHIVGFHGIGTVTAKLICVFVFANADCWFSHEAALIFPKGQNKQQ